jgi:hypothetical protein
LTEKVTIEASDGGDSVLLSGRVGGVASGNVTIYRERPGQPRTAIGRAAITAGQYSFLDHPTQRPLVYRAVYTDPATGVPYGALLRRPIFGQ